MAAVRLDPAALVAGKDVDVERVQHSQKALHVGHITTERIPVTNQQHIEAVLRRAEQGAGVETNILRYKDLTLDADSFTVLVKDKSVSLTIREFEILKLLVENQGRVFTRESLLDSIWGYDYFGDEKIVNTHIKNIRKKLGVEYIDTIRGAGYKIDKEN